MRSRASLDPDSEADFSNEYSSHPIGDRGRPDRATEQTSTVEELAGAGPVQARGHTDRWLGLCIALATAVVTFGFAGSALDGGTATSPVASPPAPPHPIAAAATAAPVAAFMVLNLADGESADGWSMQMHALATASPAVAQSKSSVGLLVVGYVPPTIDTLTIEVRTRSASLLFSGVARRLVDDERPGSDGGPRHGLATFHQRMDLPGPIPSEGWQVEITWRDQSDVTFRSATLFVVPIAN